MRKLSPSLVLAISALSIAAVSVSGHPGGLDSNGGHNDKKNGGYHFHRSPSVPASSSPKPSQSVAPAARNTSPAPKATTPENNLSLSEKAELERLRRENASLRKENQELKQQLSKVTGLPSTGVLTNTPLLESVAKP
jgi:hypothetical protein